jgi:hypothetical protein
MSEDGSGMTVQLLVDDVGTWIPWILDKEVHPMRPVSTRYAPLLSTGAATTAKRAEL